MRKLLITATTIIFLVTASHAGEWKSMCKQVEQLAEVTMEARQRGVPMSAVMEKLDSVDASEVAEDLMDRLVIAAYEMPRYNTEEYRQEAILEFKNKAYLACIKADE